MQCVCTVYRASKRHFHTAHYKNINRATIKKKSTPTQSPGKGTLFQPLVNPEDGREHRALHKPTSELCIA